MADTKKQAAEDEECETTYSTPRKQKRARSDWTSQSHIQTSSSSAKPRKAIAPLQDILRTQAAGELVRNMMGKRSNTNSSSNNNNINSHISGGGNHSNLSSSSSEQNQHSKFGPNRLKSDMPISPLQAAKGLKRKEKFKREVSQLTLLPGEQIIMRVYYHLLI